MENYEYLGTIGEGAYGVVVKARHKASGQIVAIKKFKESDDDERVRKTALREVRILKQLKHDNIVELLEVFRRKGKLYLVFEFVQRTLLEDLEGAPDGLPDDSVKNFIWQLLRALEFCHTHNVVHRDIKPENLLISSSGVLKLCDFGFARTLAGPAGRYTDYVSTRWYRAPELLVGDQGYGKAVDIWAVGCLMAEIAHGLPLFPGESDLDQLSHIIWCFGKLTPRLEDLARSNPQFSGAQLPQFAKLDSLQQKLEGVSAQQLDVIQQCLAYEPMQRPTCTDLLRHPFFKAAADEFMRRLQEACKADAENKLGMQQPRRTRRHSPAQQEPAVHDAGDAAGAGPGGAAARVDARPQLAAGGGSAGSGGTREHTHAHHSAADSIASDYTSPRSEHGMSTDTREETHTTAEPLGQHSEDRAREAAAEERLRKQLAADREQAESHNVPARANTVDGFGDLGGFAQASLSSVNSDAEEGAPAARYGDDVRRHITSRSGMRSQQRDRNNASVAAEGRALDKDWQATAAGIRASLNETLQHEHRLRKLEADRLKLRSQGGLARTRSRGGVFESGGGEGKQDERSGLDASGSVGNLSTLLGEHGTATRQRTTGGLRSIVASSGAGGSSDDNGRWGTGRRAQPRTLPSMSSGEGSAGDGELSGDERARAGAASAGGIAPRIVAMPPPASSGGASGDGAASDSKSQGGAHGGGKTADPGDAGMNPLGGRFRHGLGALQGLRPLPSLNETDDDDAGSFAFLGGARARNVAGSHHAARGGTGNAGLHLGGVALHSTGGGGGAAGGGLRALGGGGLQRSQGQPATRGGWQAVPSGSTFGSQNQALRSQGLGSGTPSRWGGGSSAARGGSGMGMSGVPGAQLRSHRPMALSGMGLGLSQRSQAGGGPGSSHRFGSGAGLGTPSGARRMQARGMPATPQSYSQRGRMALRGATGLSNLRMA